MKFSTLAVAPLVCLISASPVANEKRQALCSGLTSNMQCCAVDVLGVADLNCANRMSNMSRTQVALANTGWFIAPTTPTSAADFQAICAAIGQEARCCAIPVVCSICKTYSWTNIFQLDQALVCSTPVGVA